jgi:DNA primase
MFGKVFVSLAPDHLTQEFAKADRRPRIYMDTGRNGYSARSLPPTRCARKRARW